MPLDRSNEPVSTASQRFDIARIGGGISQRLAHLIDRCVEAVVEVDKSVGGPELLLQLFARDHFTRPLQQQGQHLERLPLQAQHHAALAQFACAEIELKLPKARDSAVVLWHSHGRRRSVAGRCWVVGGWWYGGGCR